jgi:hypothetical protein
MAIGVMPALEMAQESDKVRSWLKQEGEIVAKGEPLLEVEADKAVMEIESPGESILTGCVRKKNLCCGSVGRSVCASINSSQPQQPTFGSLGKRAVSRPSCGISSRCRRGDWQSGAVFRLSGAWVVYFAKTPRH